MTDLKPLTAINNPTSKETGANEKANRSAAPNLSSVPLSNDGKIHVQRAPRLKQPLPADTVEILPPPQIPSRPEINWLSTLLPAFTTVAIAIVMAVAMGNARMMIYTLPMTAIGLFLTVTNFTKSRKKYARNVENREKGYAAHLENKARELHVLQKQQHSVMASSNPKTMDCMDIVRNRTKNLWERVPEDNDFGSARIGRGPVSASFQIKVPGAGSSLNPDPLLLRARSLKEQYGTLADAPVTCNFFRYPVCGVAGRKQDVNKLIKNTLVQLTTHHCCTELKVVFFCDENQMAEFGWIRDLPHLHDSKEKSVFLAASAEQAENLLDSFADLLETRDELLREKSAYGKSISLQPYYLFVFLQPGFLPRKHAVTRYLFRQGLGTGVIMVADTEELLPMECQQIIRLTGDSGEFFHKENSSRIQKFRMDTIKLFDFQAFGQAMKPLTYVNPHAADALPEKYTFYQMLGISRIDELDLARRWAASNILRSMAVPIGIAGKKELLQLDILHGAHGPHGLMAGTTGSGKSEVLISYMLSLAVTFSPLDLNFFIIDYKSGLPNQLAQLPHTVGLVRDIDAGDLDRSLVSVRAEINRRKLTFDKVLGEEKTIGNYISLFKSGKVSKAIPHLIILVDEFAELKKEHPEFIKELVSLARIGRSLGVHLILATQTPNGVVDDQISSNSTFRICLKLKNKSDSTSFIGSPLAAHITAAGRGYLQVGNDEIFEQFQSGYSGCDDAANPGMTQRAAVIRAICSHCAAVGMEKRENLYLPALPKRMDYACGGRNPAAPQEIRAAFGVYDAPELQRQPPAVLTISGQNTQIVASSQFGKTNLLQTVIRSLAEQYTPQELNIYILDFDSMFLRNYASLPHVGGVATAQESEKVKNLFRMLLEEIDARREKISRIGLTTFSSYLEAGYRDLPSILLMVDNFAMLKELYLQDGDPLLQIMRTGLAWGVSVIVTNSQTSGFSHQYAPVISNKIALYCNEPDQYNSLFGFVRMRLPEVPGRFMMTVNKTLYEGQSYLAFEGEREIDRYNRVRDFIQSRTARCPGIKARPIPAVPEQVAPEHLYGSGNGLSCAETIALGMDYVSVSPVGMDLDSQFMISLIGRDPKNKKAFLESLLADIGRNLPSRPVKLFFLDSLKRDFRAYENMPYVYRYGHKTEDICDILETVSALLEQRSRSEEDTASELLLVIINNASALDALSGSKTHMKLFENISKNYRSLGVLFLFADVENSNVGFGSPEILKKIRDHRSALIFDSLKDMKLFDISIQQQKKHTAPLGPSDGFYLCGDEIYRIKWMRGD